MSDDADRSDERIQITADAGIHAARAALYCDGDCAADHAADQRRNTGKNL